MIKKERPFFTVHTKLKDIPRDWLIDIEPKIMRGTMLGECWIWNGAIDRDGRPVMHFRDPVTHKMKMRRLARYVMKMFFPSMATHNDVINACGNRACLNPHHLSVRIDHWTQREGYVNRPGKRPKGG